MCYYGEKYEGGLIMKRNIKLLLSMIVMSIGITAFGNINVFASVEGYTWMDSGAMSTGRENHTVTLLNNGGVLVVGGRNSSLSSGYLNTAELYDPSNKTWKKVASMSVARANHTATLIKDKNGRDVVLVVGGINYNSGTQWLNTAEIYDPINDTWTYADSMSVAREKHTATLLPDGTVLVVGGKKSSSVNGCLKTAEIYDPINNNWTLLETFMANARFSHTATFLSDIDSVLVVGGYKTGNDTDIDLQTVEKYNYKTKTWTSVHKINSVHHHHTATLIKDPDGTSKVLVVGGISATPEKYDYSTDTWTDVAKMNYAYRENHTATLLQDGRVLIAGTSSGLNSNSTEIYNPNNNTWTMQAPMAIIAENHAATLLNDGRVLVTGGYSNVTGHYTNAAEIYAPNTVAWSSTSTTMSGVRSQHTATLIKDKNGKVGVLVVGGYKNPNNYLNTAEIYGVNSKTWANAKPMKYARKDHTATLLQNGKVLIAGGYNKSDKYLNSVEIYDPDTGEWSDAKPMLSKRNNHTATLLPNGKVLVTGGHNSDGNLITAEIYDPVNNEWTLVKSMYDPRANHAATLIKDKNDKYVVLVFGGYSEDSRTVEAYDYSTGNWTRKSQMLDTPAPGSFRATVLADQKVLITGDNFSDDGDKAYIYNYDLDTWTQIGDLNQSRKNHQAILLPNGKVLVIGGGYYNGVSQVLLKSVEIYDQDNNRWLYVADMCDRRYYGHTATVLPDGSVLVAGGEDNYHDAINTAELLASPMVPDTTAPTATSVTSSARYTNATTFTWYANAVTDNGGSGVSVVKFPTWIPGYNNPIWVDGTYDAGNNRWYYNANIASFGNIDATYHTDAYAYDNAGNSAYIGSADVTVDTTAPTVVLTSHTSGAYYSNDPALAMNGTSSDTDSGVNRVEYGAWGNNFGAWTQAAVTGTTNWSKTFTGLAGHNRIHFSAWDNAGNEDGYTNGSQWWSAWLETYIDSAAPNTPSVPTVTVVSPSEIDVGYTIPTDNGSGDAGVPYVNNPPNLYTAGDVGVVINNGASDISSYFTTNGTYQHTGLTPNTQYVYRVIARDNTSGSKGSWFNYSGWTSTVSKYTLANMPSSQTYGTITQMSMVLNWSTNGNPSSTQYFAAVVANGADPENMANWLANSGWQTNISTWTATGLTAGTQYRAYVKAKNVDEVRTNWTDFGAKWTIPNMPNNIVGNNDGLAWSSTAGRGWVTLSWPAETGATGYTVQVWDGNAYRAFDIGNTTSWDSRTAKIYPAENTLNALGDNTQSSDLFNHSTTGLDLRDNPNTLYKKTIETTYDIYTNYWFRVTAYNSSGDSGIDWTQGYYPTLPNRTATSAPGVPAINFTSPVGYISGNWSNSNVSFTITNGIDNGGSGIQKSQYSTNEGSSWIDYTSEVIISTQGTTAILARTIDNAGNIGSNTSININIDTTSPTITFNPASGSSIYTTDSVTITANDPDDAVSTLYYKWDTDAYASVIGGTKTVAPPSLGGLCTLYAYATDSHGNTSTVVPSTYSVVIPVTLNVPTVFGSGYYNENALLSATGANFDDASYRIYYTTNATSPTISAGSNPGVGWIDSGVANTMTINSSISISEVIAGTDLSNLTWTYVTFKVWAASSTGDSAIKYTTAYSLTDNPSNVDSYIGKIAHNQILTNGTVIANPNDVSNNVYIDGDIVRYRLELDVLKPSRIKDMNITLDCNLYNDPNIQLQLNSIVLKKGTESPIGSGQYTYAPIKDLSGIATDGPVGGTNRYNFLLGNDNGGTPIIIANGIGRYAIEYTGRIKANYSQIATSTVIRNDAQIKVYTGSGLYPNTIEQDRPNRKSYMDTNVSKMVVRYA